MILIEQIRKHGETCGSGEILKMLGKLGNLPGSNNISDNLDSSFNSTFKNLRSQKKNSSISGEVIKSRIQPEIKNLLAMSESLDS